MKITDYFDKIFVINLLERDDRRNFMLQQFIKMGWGDELLSGKIEFVEAVKIPCLQQHILTYMRETNAGDFYSLATQTDNVGLCNCSIEHYRVIKRAYLKGYNRILVLEDDACFLKDLSFLEKALQTMPENFDILHLEGFFCPKDDNEAQYATALAKTPMEGEWKSSYLFKMFGAAALIYSRQGMERYLINQETSMHYSDYYTFLMDVDSYFFSYPLVIQQEYVYSDIVERNNNALSLNLYTTHINRDDYYNFWEI